jgi:hypothetical protein
MPATRKLWMALVAVAVGALLMASAASAATYTPGTTDDTTTVDPADCVADAPASADCTLREAVAAANGTEDDDVIQLATGTYTLDPTIEHRGLIIAPDSESGSLLIRGTGARNTTIDGDGTEDTARVFTFDSGSIAEVQDLKVTGGKGNDSSNGGAVKIRDNPDAHVTFTRTWITGNSVDNSGGAISNRAKLIIQDSLLSDNIAGENGGAIENDDELTLINTTLTGNQANGQHDTETLTGTGTGGAVNNTGSFSETDEPGTMTAVSSTIAGNSATGTGGGIFTTNSLFVTQSSFAALTSYTNTIVADNAAPSAPNCSGNASASDDSPSSHGHNLENGTSCEFTAAGDRNAEPLLGTLANNGGPTDTLAELDGSPAIDAGDAGTCTPADQRGVGRPQGPVCDIGAFERGPAQQQQQQQPVLQTPTITQTAATTKCKDHLPPITTLHHSGLDVSSSAVKLKGRSRDQGKPCPVGVQRVEVSLAQVSGMNLNCRFLKFNDRFALTPFRNCRRQSVRFRATGTTSWNFTFKVSLAPGKYRAQARGYDKLRHKETPRKHRNIIFFTVK